MNEYLQEFNKMRAKSSGVQEQWIHKRKRLVEHYSWAVPNTSAINKITTYSPIVEIGAGKGYWAKLLQDNGATVYPYDIEQHEDSWTDVYHGGPVSVKEHPDAALLLCWPPYDTDMAVAALSAHMHYCDNPSVFYVGEGMGGCTGSDDFHEVLEDNFEKVSMVRIPSYSGVRDNLYHYVENGSY